MPPENTARRPEGEVTTPAEAIARLVQMSDDVRSALLLDGNSQLAAASDADRADAMRMVALELLEQADADAGGEVKQVEVTAPAGAVFCVRDRGWTLVAVTVREALSSLMFYDMRSVLGELAAADGSAA